MFLHKPFRGPHGHSDGASFVTYFNGKPFIVDSGGPYSYGHPMRYLYFQSQFAHNTVVFGGRATDYRTALLSESASEKMASVALCAEMVEGKAYWTRLFSQSASNYQLVLDWVIADEDLDIESRLHLDPDVQVEEMGGLFELHHSGDTLFLSRNSMQMSDELGRKKHLRRLAALDLLPPKPGKVPNQRQLTIIEDGYDKGSFINVKDGQYIPSRLLTFSAPNGSLSVTLISPSDEYSHSLDVTGDVMRCSVYRSGAIDQQLEIELGSMSHRTLRTVSHSL